jgi:predicted small lipoprotein YifL
MAETPERSNRRRWLLAALLLLPVAACGRKGPLELPKEEEEE